MQPFACVLLAGAAALLAGCVSPEEQRAMDQQKCAGFGFGPGSDAFAQCMMSTAQQRDAQQAADRRAWQERQARDAEAKAASANANASPGPATPPPPQKQKCTSTTTTVGNTTTTHEECSSSSW